jgi:DNA repair photolyase
MRIASITAASILTKTGGYLNGVRRLAELTEGTHAVPPDLRDLLPPIDVIEERQETHSLNPFVGCLLGNTLCGRGVCYAARLPSWSATRHTPDQWGEAAYVKENAPELYVEDYRRLKARKTKTPLKIFLSTSTEPYSGWERRHGLTRRLLERMVEYPPDLLWVQSHTDGVIRDLDLLQQLTTGGCTVVVSISVETDRETLPGFPGHGTPIHKRMAALRHTRAAGIETRAAVSPILPVADVERFATTLGQVADRIIVDHYLIGDGTWGRRTMEAGLPARLQAAGFEAWTHLDTFWDLCRGLTAILGSDRLYLSIFV